MKKMMCVVTLALIATFANAKEVKTTKSILQNPPVQVAIAEEIKLTKLDVFKDQMRVFDGIDANNDNKLTKEEFLAKGITDYDATYFINRIDDSKKGYVAKIDVLYSLSKEFDMYDTNKDGSLTADELLAGLIRQAKAAGDGYKFNEDEFKSHHPYHHKKQRHHHCE